MVSCQETVIVSPGWKTLIAVPRSSTAAPHGPIFRAVPRVVGSSIAMWADAPPIHRAKTIDPSRGRSLPPPSPTDDRGERDPSRAREGAGGVAPAAGDVVLGAL